MFQAMLPALWLVIPVCLASMAAGWLLIRYGPRDAGGEGHKDHVNANPTAGGLAVFVAIVPAVLIVMFFRPEWQNWPFIVIMAGAFLMLLMGLWDDLVNLPALPKLVVQCLVALGIGFVGIRVETLDLGRDVYEVGFVVGLLGSAFWLVLVTNAVNFMDGSDGLAMGSGAAISAGLVILALVTGATDTASYALILFAALIGLLVWNGRGKLFAGDTGSLFVGFLLAALTLHWISQMDLSVWIGPCLFVGFLADVVLTLIWRFRHGRKLLSPHREHIFQIALKAGVRPYLAAWIYVWITLHGILIAGISLMFPIGGAMIGFCVFFGLLYLISIRIRMSAIRHGHLIP